MKIGIHVWVDEKDWTKFKEFCLRKHGKLHQVLGEELSQAIRHYLECALSPSLSTTMVPSAHEEHVDDEDTRPNVNPKLMQELEAIVAEIAKDFEPGGQIPIGILKEKVVRVLGPCGENKISNRIRLLRAFDVIGPDPGFPNGRVYIVKKLSIWSGGTHGGPDPAGGLRGEWWRGGGLQV
jgi:hypothetical protein